MAANVLESGSLYSLAIFVNAKCKVQDSVISSDDSCVYELCMFKGQRMQSKNIL